MIFKGFTHVIYSFFTGVIFSLHEDLYLTPISALKKKGQVTFVKESS